MLDRMMDGLDFHGKALELQSRRQQLLSSNIANADTPYYKARDFNFQKALRQAAGMSSPGESTLPMTAPGGASGMKAVTGDAGALQRTHASHLSGTPGSSTLGGGFQVAYRQAEQGAVDGNTVDMNRERSNFADNALHYQATLRFIDGRGRSLTSAIKGD